MSKPTRKQTMRKGFSLIETMITMTVFFVVMGSVYMMIKHSSDAGKTEQSRLRLQQESRFMLTSFAEEIRDAGAMLTLAHIGGFLQAPPNFNGIYPLNKNAQDMFPDGIIVAAGDPEAVTRLVAEFTPGGGTLQVEKVNVESHDPTYPFEDPQWGLGDKGIVLGKDGYYVFYVQAADIGGNTLTVRAEPVYYSGMLDTANYADPEPVAGNSVTYPKHAPVIRLANFSIYLTREIATPGAFHNIRQLIRVIDSHGDADVLNTKSPAEISIVSENIYDMQISYIAYDKVNFKAADRNTVPDPNHHYYAGGSTSTSDAALLTDIRARLLKEIDIFIVALTDDYGASGGKQSRRNLNIPVIHDGGGYTIPDSRMNFKILNLSIQPKNFSIAL